MEVNPDPPRCLSNQRKQVPYELQISEHMTVNPDPPCRSNQRKRVPYELQISKQMTVNPYPPLCLSNQ